PTGNVHRLLGVGRTHRTVFRHRGRGGRRMSIFDRVKKMPYVDIDQQVYTLTVEDALCIIGDNVDEEELDALTDAELDNMIQAVSSSFGHIEWSEYGEAGLSSFLYDKRQLASEDNEKGEF